MQTNEDGYTYDQWYQTANASCLALSGIGLDDLPDGLSHDAWQDNCPPLEYAEELLLEDGFPFPEGHRYYQPPRRPTNRHFTSPNGTYYREILTLANGQRIEVERSHSANGYVRFVGYR